MKTPEEMAEEYTKDWWGNLPEAEGMRKSARENFLAGYKAATPQWVSTKDMLPKIGEYVLVTHRTSQDSDSLVVMEAKRLNESEYIIDGGDGILVEYVDHWMPLPKAPEE